MKRADHEIAALRPPGARELHAFIVSLDIPDTALAAARQDLDATEIARADAFLRPRDRRHFTAARSWLRRMLAAHLGRRPADLVFVEGPHGKPRLAEESGRLDFNLSHSDGHGLLVVSPGFAIGADIEAEREIEDKLAERFFSALEVRALDALPKAERTAAFFRCWSRKEAYLKALGSGLATPLDGFTVSLDAGDARLVEVAGEPGEASHWRMADLAPAPGLAGAVAARCTGWRLLWPIG